MDGTRFSKTGMDSSVGGVRSCFQESGRKIDVSESHPLLLGDVPGLQTMSMTNWDPPRDI